jgi:CheY-like chemotaxis protein
MNTQDHILIVDDDREIRTLLGDYLQKHGFRTSAVADGKGLWSVLDSARVDLVILDVMLPGLDGVEVCRRLSLDCRCARGDDSRLQRRRRFRRGVQRGAADCAGARRAARRVPGN